MTWVAATEAAMTAMEVADAAEAGAAATTAAEAGTAATTAAEAGTAGSQLGIMGAGTNAGTTAGLEAGTSAENAANYEQLMNAMNNPTPPVQGTPFQLANAGGEPITAPSSFFGSSGAEQGMAPNLGYNTAGSGIGPGSAPGAGVGQGSSGVGLGQGSTANLGGNLYTPDVGQSAQSLAYDPSLTPGGPAQQALLGANATPLPSSPDSSFISGLKSVGEYASAHPFQAGLAGYGILSATGALRNQGPNPTTPTPFYNPYHLSPNFQGTHPNPSQYQYTPHYASGGMAMGGLPNQMYPMSQQEHTNFMDPTQMPASAMAVRDFEPATNPMTGTPTQPMASGGITDVHRFRSGGMDVYDASLKFANMMDNPNNWSEPDTTFHSVKTFQDTNPNTANKTAAEAAAARAASINKRSYVDTGYKYPTASRQPGQLNLSPVGTEQSAYDNQESVLAANGGIMQYSLGGYAQGDMPRLLRGPGDGVSDNIPATIADRQPARLADGEFVIPARIVSELGNGSTDAGAKRLHKMMDDVQKARGRTVGKDKVAVDSKAYKAIPKK